MGKTELLKIVQEMLDTVEPLLEESADAYFIRMDDMYLTKGGEKMLPAIDKKKTGINLRLMMDER